MRSSSLVHPHITSFGVGRGVGGGVHMVQEHKYEGAESNPYSVKICVCVHVCVCSFVCIMHVDACMVFQETCSHT